jgi:hypothetical protein
MQIRERSIAIRNHTLNVLITELNTECQTVAALVHQLQLPSLTLTQQANILAELLAAAIHLQAHCGEDLQNLIAEELEALPDSDED